MISSSQPGDAHSQQNNMYQVQALRADFEFLSLPEVAEVLRISRLSVYRMVAKQILTVYRVGRRMRFRKEDVLQYLERNRYGSKEN